MSDDPGLILLMGNRTEHALTSIQCYVPSVVHIVTSTDFKSQNSRRLKSWSEKYGFRKGEVRAVDDLFENTAVNSILSEICQIADKEKIGEDKTRWYIGITGGTMHMAATGMYAALLLGIIPFYVIKPPEGQVPMPNRDVLQFPSLSGLNCAMGVRAEDLDYLMQGEGKMQEFASRMPEIVFKALCGTGLIEVEEDKWKMTSEGLRTISFAASSMPVREIMERQKAINEAKEKDALADGVGFYIG